MTSYTFVLVLNDCKFITIANYPLVNVRIFLTLHAFNLGEVYKFIIYLFCWTS